MSTPCDSKDTLNVVAGVFLWCFIFSMAGLFFWLFMVVVCGDWAYNVHTTFFHLSREQFGAIHYALIIIAKLTAFGFFLFPYLGIKLVQRKCAD